MKETKESLILVQYYIYFSALPFYFIGWFVGYSYMKYKDVISISFGTHGFWFPYFFIIIIISYLWNTLLINVNVLGHLYYLNGVENVYSKKYKAENNITA